MKRKSKLDQIKRWEKNAQWEWECETEIIVGLTSTESRWSFLIIFPSITNIVSVRIPATTCLKSNPIYLTLKKTFSDLLLLLQQKQTNTNSLTLSEPSKRKRKRGTNYEEIQETHKWGTKENQALGSFRLREKRMSEFRS